MNVDDPKLTAYALGELSEAERAKVERVLRESPEAHAFVNETHELAQVLKKEFQRTLVNASDRPANLIDIRDDPWFWSIARPLAIAAVLAVLGLISAVFLSRYQIIPRIADRDRLVNLPTSQLPAAAPTS